MFMNCTARQQKSLRVCRREGLQIQETAGCSEAACRLANSAALPQVLITEWHVGAYLLMGFRRPLRFCYRRFGRLVI